MCSAFLPISVPKILLGENIYKRRGDVSRDGRGSVRARIRVRARVRARVRLRARLRK
jgi:hypothetical protein